MGVMSLDGIDDAAEPPRTFDELRVRSGPPRDEDEHRSRRGLAVGALVAMGALVGGLLVVRNKTDEGTHVEVVDAVPASPATTVPPVPATGPSVETTVGATVPRTTTHEPELTVE